MPKTGFHEPPNTVLSREQHELVLALLARGYRYGDRVAEHQCTHCGRPKALTWQWGVRCLWMYGGCGKDLEAA